MTTVIDISKILTDINVNVHDIGDFLKEVDGLPARDNKDNILYDPDYIPTWKAELSEFKIDDKITRKIEIQNHGYTNKWRFLFWRREISNLRSYLCYALEFEDDDQAVLFLIKFGGETLYPIKHDNSN